MKIGFIGVGAMAQAIVQGLLRAEFVPASNILVHSARKNHYTTYADQNGLTAVASNTELVKQSDIVVLAVVPKVVTSVLTEIKSALTPKQTLVSIVSGISLDQLAQMTTNDQPILRTLPNINSEFGAGMTAVAANDNLTGTALQQATDMFAATGEVLELAEDQFAVFSAISGSAVAYVDFFIDALSRAGVKYGLNKQVATKIAAQTTLGSAKSLLDADVSPAEMIDQVCSPGGDTIAGILAMEKAGFLSSVVSGIDATIAKSTGKTERD